MEFQSVAVEWNNMLLLRKNRKSKRTLHNDLTKSRKITKSIKERMQCPFVVHFTYLARSSGDKKGYIYYRVKVSKVCGIHKCVFSRETMHTAEVTTIGKMKHDLKHMNLLLGMLKCNPSLDARSIRPILNECVKTHFNVDSKLINNFRMRAAL